MIAISNTIITYIISKMKLMIEFILPDPFLLGDIVTREALRESFTRIICLLTFVMPLFLTKAVDEHGKETHIRNPLISTLLNLCNFITMHVL